MNMVDMAKSAEEVKEETAWSSPMAVASSIEKYPWGLSLCLEKDSLKKLGLDGSMPEVGSTVKFSAEARVTSVSASEREDGESNNTVSLQIVRMALPADEAQQQAAQRNRWYGGDTDKDGA